MSESEKFKDQVEKNIDGLVADKDLKAKTIDWMLDAGGKHQYSYNFSWMGRPIIQFPQDMMAMQELIWETQPNLIIETGIAHGGSLIFYASLLEMNAISGGSADAVVVGIDIDIRDHNRKAIEAHSMYKRIEIVQGSSIDADIIKQIHQMADGKSSVMVVLDSNHTHKHVLAELEAYAPLVTKGSYCVVFDTLVEDVSGDYYLDRPWGPGDNPKTAVWEYLEHTQRFEIDKRIESKILITVAPDGFLKCVKD